MPNSTVNGRANSPGRKMRILRLFAFAASLLSLGAGGCATVSHSLLASEASPEAYAKSSSTKGVVILAVNWSRRWNCGGYENAEIMSLGFDRLPMQDGTNDRSPEVFIDGPSRLTKKPIFLDYALLLDPGEYALTSFDVNVAQSASDVGHFVAKRSHLLENGQPKAGSFEVKGGETVYIGHFFLDCHKQPTLWRYYTESRDDFRAHMSEVKQKYPFIDPDRVTYRLFRTTTIGQNYQLPQ